MTTETLERTDDLLDFRTKGGGNCFRPGEERGPWFELKCIRENIDCRAAEGDPAEYERRLYLYWIKELPSFAEAEEYNRRQGFYGVLTPFQNSNSATSATKKDATIIPVVNNPNFETTRRGPGRPRKENGFSRTTAWRRNIETQGVLI